MMYRSLDPDFVTMASEIEVITAKNEICRDPYLRISFMSGISAMYVMCFVSCDFDIAVGFSFDLLLTFDENSGDTIYDVRNR